jgi:hypothetical protein
VYEPGPLQTNDESGWKLKPAAEILDLKVADIAAGSGAFLVAAARYLAERLVEAWTAEDMLDAELVDTDDLRRRALRDVIARCLYGADINPMAVEMCKLSLWLVSMNKTKPFSFVDDKIFCGNALLGITELDQLRHLHIYPEPAKMDRQIFVDVDEKIATATRLRHELANPVDERDPMRSTRGKLRLLRQTLDATDELRLIADSIVAAGLPLGGKPGRQLNDAYKSLAWQIQESFPGAGLPVDKSRLSERVEANLRPTVETDYERWIPLHWVIEAPDVLVEHGGFDAIIGNPPFLGGQKLTGAMGTPVRDWLVSSIAGGRRGSADLVAYFLLRATSLLQAKGTIGLIATNTVAQGDTREVGLDAIVTDGFTITRAVQSRSWPASSANLEYAAIWGTLATVVDEVSRMADDIPVRRISTLLEPAGRAEGNPVRLAENTGIAFQGCIVLGMGFVLDTAEAQKWIAADARNAEVLFPYLNGEDLNSRPDASASRWVIDFNDRTEAEAAKYPIPFTRVRERVKPERAKLRGRNATADDRAKNWWKYGRRSPAMRKAIASLSEVLVVGLVSKTVMPMRVPADQVFSHKLGVFATDSYAIQALLSSATHWLWAVRYGSTLETRVNYSPSDVFETFPMPNHLDALEQIGRSLHEERREIMLRRKLGVTKLYNLVSDPTLSDDADPDVARLRQVHVKVDHAVRDAYGWTDLDLGYGFHAYRKMERWTVGPTAQSEILDRLLEENQRRASVKQRNSSSASTR